MTQSLLLQCCNPKVSVPPPLLYISPDASHRHYQIRCVQDQASESIHQHFVRPRVSTALTRPGLSTGVHGSRGGHETLTSRDRSNRTLSPVARHRCDVSSALCCPLAKSRRWIPSFVRYTFRHNTASGMKI